MAEETPGDAVDMRQTTHEHHAGSTSFLAFQLATPPRRRRGSPRFRNVLASLRKSSKEPLVPSSSHEESAAEEQGKVGKAEDSESRSLHRILGENIEHAQVKPRWPTLRQRVHKGVQADPESRKGFYHYILLAPAEDVLDRFEEVHPSLALGLHKRASHLFQKGVIFRRAE